MKLKSIVLAISVLLLDLGSEVYSEKSRDVSHTHKIKSDDINHPHKRKCWLGDPRDC